MKKSLLLFFFAIGVIAANAQINITTADVAVPVKVIYQANDTLPTISVGTAGVSQVWNMTDLNVSTTDTLNFITYGWAPNSNFAISNLVMKQGSGGNYAYLINSSTGLTILGSAGVVDLGGGPVAINQINSPAEIIMTFPATYNTTYTNNYTTTTPAFAPNVSFMGIPIDSLRSKSVARKTVLVDAWGSLTTPLGTYNVIRSKETIIKNDTSDAYFFGGWNDAIQTTADSTTGYTWWANGIGFPLVSVKLDSLGGLKQVEWLQSLPLVGINEYVSASNVNVYPNPAQNEINLAIDASTVSAVQFYDIMGKIAGTFPISMDVTTVNTSGFANGAYTFSVIGNDKTILARGKFTIAK